MTNLFVSVAYDHSRIRGPLSQPQPERGRGISRRPTRARALRDKAPRLVSVRTRPAATLLIWSRPDRRTRDNLRLNFRQRFSIFNVTATIILQGLWRRLATDSLVGGRRWSRAGRRSAAEAATTSDSARKRCPPTTTTWRRTGRVSLNRCIRSTAPEFAAASGIFLTSALQTNSGRYYAITTGKDDNMDSSPNDRPPGVERNAGPAMWSANVNFNVSKAFFFGARPAGGGTQPNVNVFANMTNAFNRPNYNNPSGIMTSPNFGRITSAGTPREIEVGLRFQF